MVGFAEINSNRCAARNFCVNEKRVREWRRQKGELLRLPRKKKRLHRGGRKVALSEMEEELAAWIVSTHSYMYVHHYPLLEPTLKLCSEYY